MCAKCSIRNSLLNPHNCPPREGPCCPHFTDDKAGHEENKLPLVTSRAGLGTQTCLTAEPNRLHDNKLLPSQVKWKTQGSQSSTPTTGLLRGKPYLPSCSSDLRPHEERGSCTKQFCAGRRSSEQGRKLDTCHPLPTALSQQRFPTLAPTLPAQRPVVAS